MGTRTLSTLLSILKKEHPSKPGTGLRFSSLRRGLTCIILLRQPTLRTDSFSSFHTPILIVRFISTTAPLLGRWETQRTGDIQCCGRFSSFISSNGQTVLYLSTYLIL